MKSSYPWRWWTVELRGVFAVLFGLASLFVPRIALLTLVALFGAFAIVNGVLALALASKTMRAARTPMIADGLVSIVAGVVALVWPTITTVVLLAVIAAWAIVSGLLEVVTAIRLRKQAEHEWMLGLEGAVSIAFGVLLILAPSTGALVLAVWIGAFALVLGGLLIGTGLRMRSFARQHPEVTAAAA
jgi:uncharacterized membrane protein HdeD (DUF308 family)